MNTYQATSTTSTAFDSSASTPDLPFLRTFAHLTDAGAEIPPRRGGQISENVTAGDIERDLYARIQNGDRGAVWELVLTATPMIKRVANDYRSWGVPREDLVSSAQGQAFKKASKFDPYFSERTDPDSALFSSFIENSVIYAIEREIRTSAFTVPISDSAFKGRRKDGKGRSRDGHLVAIASGWTDTVRLDAPLGDGEGSDTFGDRVRVGSTRDEQSDVDIRVAFEAAISSLTDRQKQMAGCLRLELTGVEAAEVLGISKGAESKLRARTIALLQVALAAFRPVETETF